jgi:hypothetical protein
MMNRSIHHILHDPYKRSLLLLILFLIVYETILYFGIGLRQPTWADEHHFIPTIEGFGRDFSLRQIQTYNDMSTPLPFILYALWGKIAGFSLHQLRFFSLIISFCTFITFYIFYYMISGRIKTATWAIIFLIFQPYLIGLSVFVYTDMLALLFMAVSLIAFVRNRPILLAISIAGTLLCRQYFIFLAAAFSLYYLIQILLPRDRNSYKMFISSLVSLAPVTFLFILWGGFSPQNEMRDLYLEDGINFHPEFLVLYISLFFVYLFPVIIFTWKKYYTNLKILLLSIPLSLIYFLFPVRASQPSIDVGVYTVGFFHRFIRMVFGDTAEHYVFYLMILLSLPVLLCIIRDTYSQIKSGKPNAFLFTGMSIILFLIIMPFSYLTWEKYFLPIIPIALVQILGLRIFKNFSGTTEAA